MVKDTQPFSIKGLEVGRGGGDTADAVLKRWPSPKRRERDKKREGRESSPQSISICFPAVWGLGGEHPKTCYLQTLPMVSLQPLRSLHLSFKNTL